MKVVLVFERKSTGSVVQIVTSKPEGSGPFGFVEGFNGFEITHEMHYEGYEDDQSSRT